MSRARIAAVVLAAALAAPAGRAQELPASAAASERAAAWSAIARTPAAAPALRPAPPPALGTAPLLRMLGGSALLIGGLWFGADRLRRRARARAGPQGTIEVVAVRGLGPRHRIALVEVGSARLLIGLSHDGICPLLDLSEPVAFAPALARELPGLEPGLASSLGRFEGLDA